MKNYLTRSIIICLFSLLWTISLNADHQQYSISIPELKDLSIDVTAEIYTEDGNIHMSNFGAWGIKEGWAKFVRINKVINDQGQEIEIEKKARNLWSVPVTNRWLTVKYSVDYSYASAESWPDGARAIGSYYNGKALYTIGHSLFLYGKKDIESKVVFHTSEMADIFVPWKKIDKKAFLTENIDHLLTNSIVIGEAYHIRFPAGSFDVSLLSLDQNTESLGLLPPVIQKHLNYYQSFIDHGKEDYQIVLFKDKWETGESFNNSYTMTLPKPIKAEDSIFWSSTVGHELFHFYNGHNGVNAKDWNASQWFQEGVTDYIASLSQLKNKMITEKQFISKIEQHTAFYLFFKAGRPFDKVSLVEAGKNKSLNKVAIYDGGWLVAFCIDILIREKTENKMTIENFMNVLYNKFARANIPYKNEELFEVLTKQTGSDFTDFFERFVNGLENLPLNEILPKGGMDIQWNTDEVYVTPLKGNLFGFK